MNLKYFLLNSCEWICMCKILISETETALSETIFKKPEDQAEIGILSWAKPHH